MTSERVSDERLAEIAGDGSPNFAIGKGDFNEFRRICRELQSLRSAREAEPHPRISRVRAHKYTCAAVQPGSTILNKCDCGALDTAGNAIEIHPSPSTSAEQVEISDEMVALSADLRRYNDWLMSIRIPGHEITALQAGNAMLKAATALSPIPDNQVEG